MKNQINPMKKLKSLQINLIEKINYNLEKFSYTM